MRVDNENGVFYIPDEIANDPTNTVADLLSFAVPWDDHKLNEENLAERRALLELKIEQLEQELLDTNDELNATVI